MSMRTGLYRQFAKGMMGQDSPGVVWGLVFQVPGSGLVTTYDGGYVTTAQASTAGSFGLVPTVEWSIASGTKTVTASKDTYAYIDGVSGALSYFVASNGGAKPVIGTDITANSQMLAKIVSGSSNISSVTDLRQPANTGRISTLPLLVSFETGEAGVYQVPLPADCRVLYLTGIVTKAIAGTDAGTVTAALTVNNTSTNITGGVLTFPLSSALGTVVTSTCTAANTGSTGNYLTFTTAKTTAGGKVTLGVVIEEIAN